MERVCIIKVTEVPSAASEKQSLSTTNGKEVRILANRYSGTYFCDRLFHATGHALHYQMMAEQFTPAPSEAADDPEACSYLDYTDGRARLLANILHHHDGAFLVICLMMQDEFPICGCQDPLAGLLKGRHVSNASLAKSKNLRTARGEDHDRRKFRHQPEPNPSIGGDGFGVKQDFHGRRPTALSTYPRHQSRALRNHVGSQHADIPAATREIAGSSVAPFKRQGTTVADSSESMILAARLSQRCLPAWDGFSRAAPPIPLTAGQQVIKAR
jgi:hypothetical protein